MGAGNALEELYGASYRRLVMQLCAICGNLTDAEDAVQEAFVKAIRRGRRLASVENPEAWIRTVALNHLRGGWRHSAVVRKYENRVPGPQVPVQIGPEYVAIMTALAEIDRGQREVVVLHYLADLGISEIAAELQIPEGTVKSRLARARTRLVALLDEKEEPRHA